MQKFLYISLPFIISYLSLKSLRNQPFSLSPNPSLKVNIRTTLTRSIQKMRMPSAESR